MKKIEINSQVYNIPESFDELDKHQFVKICHLLQAEVAADKFNFWAFLILIRKSKIELNSWIFWQLKAKPFFAKSWLGRLLCEKLNLFDIQLINLNTDELSEKIEELTQFIHTDQTITTNHLNIIELAGKEYNGVGNYAEFLSFGQFRACEPILMSYSDESAQSCYDQLTAVIYNIDSSLLHKIPAEIKLGIWLIYIAQRAQIVQEFPKAFEGKKTTEGEIDYEVQWQKTLHFVAEKAANYAKYDALNARDVLFELNESAIKIEIQQQYINQMKNGRK